MAILLLALAALVGGAAGYETNWATYYGGTLTDYAWGIQATGDGRILVIGETHSADLPMTEDAFDPNHDEITDGYLAIFDASGSQLLYATYLGGTGRDVCRDVALDADGNIYLVGVTSSYDFPITTGAAQAHLGGGNDAFVAKFDPTGRVLLHATYLGGSANDKGRGIVVLGPDLVAVTGYTESPDFPVTPAAWDTTYNGQWDAFLACLDLSGAGLLFSTYLGGSATEEPWDLAADAQGNLYVAGYTGSADFPTSPDALAPQLQGVEDGFLAVFGPAGDALIYSSFLGGSDLDRAWRLALSDTLLVVAGFTRSPDFPVTPGAEDTTHHGGEDVFVAGFSPPGQDLLFATFLGGTNDERAYALTLDGDGRIHVAGGTYSHDFPQWPVDAGWKGSSDAFVSTLSGDGRSLMSSLLLGGQAWEEAWGVSVDGAGRILVAGPTASPDFPTTPGAYDPTWNGERDAFVAQLTLESPPGGIAWDPAQAPRTRLEVWPNPARGSLRLRALIPRSGPVRLRLVSPEGRVVGRPWSGWLEAGPWRLTWRPEGRYAPGVYWLRLEGPGYAAATKAILR
jgi:hypothetical protein